MKRHNSTRPSTKFFVIISMVMASSVLYLASPRAPFNQGTSGPMFLQGNIQGSNPASLWNYTTGASQLFGQPIIADLEGDGFTEVIFSDSNIPGNKVWCLNGINGTVKWIANISIYNPDYTVSDVDNDGKCEIFVSETGGDLLYALNWNGSLRYTRNLPNGVWGGLILCDVDLDGEKEIVGVGNAGNITWLTAASGAFEGSYTAFDSDQLLSKPIIGDVDLDGELDVVVATKPLVGVSRVICISIFSQVQLWNFTIGDPIMSVQLIIANVDADANQEVILTACGVAYCLHGENGTIAWTYDINFIAAKGFCSAVDIDRDGQMEVLITQPAIACLNGTNGQVKWLGGTNVTGPSPVSGPMIGDVDSDMDYEILALAGVGQDNTGLYCYSASSGAQEWRMLTGYVEQTCVPSLGDLNGDGLMDIVTCSENGKVYALQGSGPAWRIPGIVPCAGGSPLMTHSFIDSDVDGLLDSLEEYLGLNTTNNDTDGDGATDYWEIVNMVNPAGPSFTISHPLDVMYSGVELGRNISWTLYSPNMTAPVYYLYQNGILVSNGTWAIGIPITLYPAGLAPGTYNFTVIAYDGAGGVVQDTVMVTVRSDEDPGTDDLPTPIKIEVIVLILIGAGAAACVVIIGVVKAKRRPATAEQRSRKTRQQAAQQPPPGDVVGLYKATEIRPSKILPEPKSISTPGRIARQIAPVPTIQPIEMRPEPRDRVQLETPHGNQKFCSRCGNAVPQAVKDIKFCVFCGEPLDPGKK